MSLADEFRRAQLDVCAELRRETSYNPSRFEQGIRDGSGDQAVAFTRHLVVNGGEGATGFWRMRKLGRQHQTIEAQVVDPHWSELFDLRTVEAAQWRLNLPDRD